MKRRLILLLCAVLLLSGCTGSPAVPAAPAASTTVPTATMTKTADLGIALQAEDVTFSGLTLVITQSGGNGSGSLTRGSDYLLEFWDGSGWQPLCSLPQRGFDLDAVEVPRNTVSRQQITFSLYGDLPPGTYRLSKGFSGYDLFTGHVSQTYTVEFQIETSEDPWGIELSAVNCSESGMTVVCTRNCGVSEDVIGTGESYILEQWDGQQWIPLVPVNTPAFRGIGWAAAPNHNTGWEVNWESFYGKLAPGTYRIGKEFTRWVERDAYDDFAFDTPSTFESRTYYAEFQIWE